jgi:DNA-binding transcriptional LysR family regulator
MSERIDKSWTVLASLETEDGLRCVDLFRRPDGTFGYEEFRRDPEDRGAWTLVRFASGLSYASLELARAAAGAAVMWLGDATRQGG